MLLGNYQALGEREEEGRSHACLRFEPDTTTMLLDDFLAGCQADAATWVDVGGMQALEDVEDLLLF